MILGSRRGERREREEDNEVEVNDITVHFKGDGRREEEGGVRRKGAGIGARKEKGKSEKIEKTGGRREIGDRIFQSLDVCGP